MTTTLISEPEGSAVNVDPQGDVTNRTPRTIPGKWVVIILLVLGVWASAGVWTFWNVHFGPFVPLQAAIASEFPKARPRIEGGRYKNSPTTLRIVLHVDFKPEETDELVQKMKQRSLELARDTGVLARYETVEIFFVHFSGPGVSERLHLKIPAKDVPRAPAPAAPS